MEEEIDLNRLNSMEKFVGDGLDLTLGLGTYTPQRDPPPVPGHDPQSVLLLRVETYLQEEQSSSPIPLPPPLSLTSHTSPPISFPPPSSTSHFPFDDLPTPLPDLSVSSPRHLPPPSPTSHSPSVVADHSTSLAEFSSSSDSSVAAAVAAHRPTNRIRRNPTQAPRAGKEETIVPPFPWATDRRVTLHTLEYLLAQGIALIEGDVQCRRCDARDRISFDLRSKFWHMANSVLPPVYLMHDRAPPEWMNPVLTDCRACAQPNCMRPVIADKKRNINWLFMFLDQTIGCCTLNQLKYCCKHTKNHRTGAKNRVLYFSYFAIYNQLYPAKQFIIHDT